MNRTTNYYVSRKNVLTWVAILCCLCAAAGYIAGATCGEGAGVSGIRVWLRVVLPTAAALLFTLTLLFGAERWLFRVAVPFWLLTVSFAYELLAAGPAWYWCVAVLALMLLLAGIFTRIISGKSKKDWLLIVIAGLYLAALVWSNGEPIHAGFSWAGWMPFLPDALFLLALIALSFAMRQRPTDGKYYPTWGDRTDGRRLRTLTPMAVVASYIMPTRIGASNYFTETLDITGVEKYIREKRAEGLAGFGITEAFLAAYVRTVAKYPAANRFLSGQRVYSRDEDIQFCMVIKKEMTTDSPDTIIKLHLHPADTAKDVYEKFHAAVAKVHETTELTSRFDGTAKAVGAIPGVLLKFSIWLLKLLDYFGLLPPFLLEVSPFHGSVFFTSMGSLGISSIYHHLYDFGNLPVFCAFGCKQRHRELQSDGSVLERRTIDYSFVLDERTVDGFYYATAFKYFSKLLQRPSLLDEPPEEILHDIP